MQRKKWARTRSAVRWWIGRSRRLTVSSERNACSTQVKALQFRAQSAAVISASGREVRMTWIPSRAASCAMLPCLRRKCRRLAASCHSKCFFILEWLICSPMRNAISASLASVPSVTLTASA